MFTNGWVKLHRSFVNNGYNGSVYLNNCQLLLLYMTSQAKFTDDEYQIVIDEKPIKIEVGQLVITKLSMKKYLGCNSRMLDKCLRTLANCGEISIQEFGSRSQKRQVVTICKYRDLQINTDNDQSSEPQVNLKRTLDEPQVNLKRTLDEPKMNLEWSTIEEGNKGKKVEKEKKDKKVEKERGLIPGSTSPGSQVWQSYRSAYFLRYGVEPPRNAMANSLCKQLTERLGGEEAAKVVNFYLGHMNQFYVSKCHQLKYCVFDAEKLYTEMQKGVKMTRATAETVDRQQERDAQYQRMLAKGLI